MSQSWARFLWLKQCIIFTYHPWLPGMATLWIDGWNPMTHPWIVKLGMVDPFLLYFTNIRWFCWMINGVCVYVCMCVYTWVQVKIGGPEQAPGPHPFHTPVPYPRSIPPWRIRSIPLFHTSDPSVMIYIYIYVFYIYIYMYLYIYTWICAVWFYICTRILERTYIHECVHARIGLLCPSPVIVLASLCLQRLLCDGRDVLGCCQLAV